MSHTATPATIRSAAAERGERASWDIWCGAVAVTLIQAGGIWDLSWHRSIGRDTFWNPAHITIQSGGILAGVVCGWLIFATTFGRSAAARAASVGVLGFRAPMGAFLAAWGGIAMVVSAPLDDWWHSAYGLDVTIVSPPHAVLLGGVLCVSIGVLVLTLAAMNRAEEAQAANFRPLERLFFYVGGVILVSQMYYVFMYINNVYLHEPRPYKSAGTVALVVFTMIAQAHRHRWSSTILAAVYMAIMELSILILPLFPAQPRLGPVFHPLTHMVPTNFPMLLIFPAIALDLVWRRTRSWHSVPLALLSGLIFIAVLVAFEWPFANFLLSKWAANRVFGTGYFPFTARPADMLQVFQSNQASQHLVSGMLQAVVLSAASGWVGILFGRWMKAVRR